MNNGLDEAKQMVATVLKIDKSLVSDDANLFSLGLVNSVDFVELVMLIERKTGHKLTLEEILSLTSVKEVELFIVMNH